MRDCHLLLLLLRWLQDLEGAKETLIHAHHGPCIVKLSAVVRRREQGHELALGEELVSVLHNLVCTADQIHVVLLEEARDNIRAEGEGDAAIVLRPAGDILVRIGPEQVAQQAAVRNLECVSTLSGIASHVERTSVGLITRRICSMELRSGLRPPCIVKIFSSMIAAIGRQLKQSVKVFQSLML